MKRYLMTFSYDGSSFYGYQKQINKKTIQNEIEDKLKKIIKEDISIIATGRTDAKVHALNQKAHFDSNKTFDLKGLKKGLNSLLDKAIYIKEIKEVSNDFHARFNVKNKEYIYKINIGDYNPLERDYVYQYNKKLNIKNIKKSFKYLIGEHNFKSFAKTDITKENYIRNIKKIKLKNKNNIITISIIGNGFFRYMIRNIVGTLIEIGEEKRTPKDIITILNKKDRKYAGKKVNPEGLYLKDIYY